MLKYRRFYPPLLKGGIKIPMATGHLAIGSKASITDGRHQLIFFYRGSWCPRSVVSEYCKPWLGFTTVKKWWSVHRIIIYADIALYAYRQERGRWPAAKKFDRFSTSECDEAISSISSPIHVLEVCHAKVAT